MFISNQLSTAVQLAAHIITGQHFISKHFQLQETPKTHAAGGSASSAPAFQVPTPPPHPLPPLHSSRIPMASSSSSSSSSPPPPPPRRSVFDAAYIRAEFAAAGISPHFIPLIWKYAPFRRPPRTLRARRLCPSRFFFCHPRDRNLVLV